MDGTRVCSTIQADLRYYEQKGLCHAAGCFGFLLLFARLFAPLFCMGHPANQLSMACHQGILKAALQR